MHMHNRGTSTHAQHKYTYTTQVQVYTCTTKVQVYTTKVKVIMCNTKLQELWVRLAENTQPMWILCTTMCSAGHVHSGCITTENALSPSCLASLSSAVSDANLLRLICCRYASLSSTVSDANLVLHCGLRLICCRWAFISL